jgi:cyanophycinase
VICGGGRLPASVIDHFMELAGGPRAKIVLIPTAASDRSLNNPDQSLALWRARGATSVQILHTRSREEANNPAFLEPLREATGVWFGGGNQALISASYVGTAVEQHLRRVLERGGVIGGTSAGAAVMTRVMIAGGRIAATEGRGFDLLPGSVVDQHFLKRNRLGRLLGFLALHPELSGFGIDEGTALVFLNDRLTVVGDSCVVACLPAAPDRSSRLEILQPGDHLIPPWAQGSSDVEISRADLAVRDATAEAAR